MKHRGMQSLLLVLFLLAAPVVLACPNCAGQEDGGYAGLLVIGAMMLFPFLVVGVVIMLLRHTGRRDVPFTPIAGVGGDSR